MRPVGAGLVVATLAAALAVPPAYAAHPSTAPVPCQVFDLAPDFAHDGTAFCLSRHQPLPQDVPNGVDAFLTTDRGHTWKQVAATGLQAAATSIWTHVLFSADYSHDHTIYVQEYTSGLFKTTDGGASFTAADPLAVGATTYPDIAAFALGAPALPAGPTLPTEAAVAYTGLGGAAVLIPPVHLPAPPSVNAPVMFVSLLAQGQPARVFAVTQSSGVVLQTALAECTAILVCTQVGGTALPAGDALAQAGSVTVNGGPTVWLTTSHPNSQGGTFRVWSYNTKLGRLSEWTSVEAAMRRLGTLGAFSNVSIANVGSRLAALVEVTGDRAVIGSADGQRWVTQAELKRAPRPGQLPSPGTSASPYFGHWLAGSGGRLFTVGEAMTSTFFGESIYCSTDGGRHWYTHC